MADIADVADLLEQIAITSVFPLGTASPSVSGFPVDIAQGWPPAADVDKAVDAQTTLVTIYNEPSSTQAMDSPINTDYVVTPPVRGVTVTISDDTVLFGGAPVVGDVVVVFLGAALYTYSVQLADTVASVAAGCLALVIGDYPDAFLNGLLLDVPSAASVSASVSGLGITARKIHQSRTQFQIVIWAPSPSHRTAVAIAIDVAIKSQVRFPLTDSTCVILSYAGTNLRDREEKQGIFRRDLLVNATYQTIELLQGREVVSGVISKS